MNADQKDNEQAINSNAKHHTLLLKKIADGDRDAFTELYKVFQPRLIKYCNRMLRNDIALAADIADEAMIEVWKSAGNFSGLSQPSTWIYSIAKFRMIGYFRKNKEVLQNDNFEQLDIEDTGLLAEEEMLITEKNEQLIENIGKLSDKHREVIELVYFRELSIKDISAMLGVSDNTIKTRMFYARKHLKAILSHEGIPN